MLFLLLLTACSESQADSMGYIETDASLNEVLDGSHDDSEENVDEDYGNDSFDNDRIEEEASDAESYAFDTTRLINFSEGDILPFIYDFPTVPRMWGAMGGWPINVMKFEKSYSRLTCLRGLHSDYESALNQFIGLMHVSGFERVTGMNATLDPSVYASDDYVVFQKDNIFVSLEMQYDFRTIISEGEAHLVYPLVYIRMAKIDDWVADAIIAVDMSNFSGEEVEFLINESQYSFFEYENIWDLLGVDNGIGGKYDDLNFSFQQLLNQSPIYIYFTGGHNGVEFLYEVEAERYHKFLNYLEKLMSQSDFARIHEFNWLDMRFLSNDHLEHLLDAQMIYSKQFGDRGWSIFINEKPTDDGVNKKFMVTFLGLRLNR